jgi:hypothetical protein
MPRLLSLLTALFTLALAPAAHAVWFPSEPVDGPAEIDALGDADLARDGDGAAVYLKRDGGIPQVFLARMVDGAWRPAEKLSAGAPATEATVTATDGGRLAVAWIAGGDAVAQVIDGGTRGPVVQLSSGGGATGVHADMGINGTAYVVWAQAGDVRAARAQATAWEGIAPPLDVDPARVSGEGAGRPRVAVSAEGHAVATWGEVHADGRGHVHARRLTGLTPSAYPQDLTVDVFEGVAAGGADSPDIDIEDDGSFAWVVFRQDAGGRSRSIARRLRGSLFEDPVAVDGGATSSEPRVDFNGKGLGAAVAQSGENGVLAAYLDKFERFQAGARVDAAPSGSAPLPLVATSERGDAAVAWRVSDGSARARIKQGEDVFAPEVVASRPDLGPVAERGVAIGSDRSGNTIVVTLQGAGGARWIAASVYDRLPGRPVPVSSSRQRPRALLKWTPGSEQWGPQRYEVFIRGRSAGTTTRPALRSRRKLRRGLYQWYVTATDRRGQVSRSRTRSFRVEGRARR